MFSDDHQGFLFATDHLTALELFLISLIVYRLNAACKFIFLTDTMKESSSYKLHNCLQKRKEKQENEK